MRVLHVVGKLDVGGAETLIMNIYRRIREYDVQFDFVTHNTEGFFIEEIKSVGGMVYFCPSYTGKNHFEYLKWWRDFFNEHPEYGIVHAHIRSTAKMILRIAKRHNIHTISHAHSTSNGNGVKATIKNWFQKNLVKYTDVALICSEEAGIWQFGKDYRNKCRVIKINNGIDSEQFYRSKNDKSKLKQIYGLQDSFVVGNVSRLVLAKNHKFLLEVFKEIKARKNNARLVLVGEGNQRSIIEDQIHFLKLEDSVLLLGERSDIPDILSMMDVFVFPSKWEGFGIAALEAQAAALPTFVSDSIPDCVCVSDLICKIPLSLSASEWAERILANCSVEVENSIEEIKKAGYDINSTVEAVLKVYHSLSGV